MIKKAISFIVSFLIAFSFSLHSFAQVNTINDEDELLNEFDSFLNNCLSSQTYGAEYNSESQPRQINTNRLIISTNSNVPLSDDYGAIDKFEGLYNLHVMQYSSVIAAENAYNNFNNNTDVNCVEFDKAIQIDEPVYDSVESNALTFSHSFLDASKLVKSTSSVSNVNSHVIEKEQVVVAVIDTGVDDSHPFFQSDNGSNRILPGIRELDNTPYSNSSHGTHIAGIIVANTPENIKIQSYNFALYDDNLNAYRGFVSNLIFEIESAVSHNADVINISMGEMISLNTNSYLLEQAIEDAIDKNIVVVVAAGNNKKNVDDYIPAGFESVITVSAVNYLSHPWATLIGGTNYGSTVDISAPGVDIYSTVPNNDYAELTGTSMAAPFVSAAAAILKTYKRTLTCSQISGILQSTATVPTNWDSSKYGAGIVNFEQMLSHSLVKVDNPGISVGTSGKCSINGKVNADYYYTTDGSTPTENSIRYTEPFYVPSGCKVIKAIAVSGNIKSDVTNYQLVVNISKKIYYKQTFKLDIPKNSKVRSIYSDDEGIVSVVEPYEPSVYGVKKGSATVTINLDTGKIYVYNITVDYSFWQWIVRLFFLGFLWM